MAPFGLTLAAPRYRPWPFHCGSSPDATSRAPGEAGTALRKGHHGARQDRFGRTGRRVGFASGFHFHSPGPACPRRNDEHPVGSAASATLAHGQVVTIPIYPRSRRRGPGPGPRVRGGDSLRPAADRRPGRAGDHLRGTAIRPTAVPAGAGTAALARHRQAQLSVRVAHGCSTRLVWRQSNATHG